MEGMYSMNENGHVKNQVHYITNSTYDKLHSSTEQVSVEEPRMSQHLLKENNRDGKI
jgi:hypothetical protein